jgi:hypothetical protein
MSEHSEAPTHPPHFEHNCGRCVYLGEAEWGGRVFDLYYCHQGHMIPTVIARASSNPHDYSSGMEMAEVDPVLFEARERAKARGLLAQDIEVSFE